MTRRMRKQAKATDTTVQVVRADDVMPYALPRTVRRARDRKGASRSSLAHARKMPPSIAVAVAVPTTKGKGSKTTERHQVVIPQ